MKKLFLSFIVMIFALTTALPGHSADAYTKYNVQLYSVTDGDTVKVVKDGKVLTLRLLLIDTPESKDPRKPVQPYAIEASNYLKSYLINANQLSIEYDNGARTDKYGRHLVYLYADNKMVNQEMVKAGYARVGYVYSQQRYLKQLRTVEQTAKNKQYKIWSVPGYVKNPGEGFDETVINKPVVVKKPAVKPAPKPATKPVVKKPAAKPAGKYPTSKRKSGAPTFMKNCTIVKKYYPYGITYKHPDFRSTFDRDKDKLGCEIDGSLKYQSWMANY